MVNYDPAQKLTHHGNNISFQFLPDLSGGVDVVSHRIVFGNTKSMIERIAEETACFTAWWFINIYPTLKSFSGMDTIKFKIITNSQ